MQHSTQRAWWQTPAFVLAALLLLAWNLRPTAVAVGPVLTQVQADLKMNGTVAGVLTALPELCFAGFGVLTPTAAGRFGMHRVIAVAVSAIVVGSVTRTFVSSTWAFLLLSGVALAGMAAANVLLPSLVRAHYPHRVGLITALYSTTMTIGLATTSILAAPLAGGLGGWRRSLLVLALGAVVSALPWLAMARWDRGHRPAAHGDHSIRMRDVARTRLGWIMAIFFGLQSAQAYTVFGWLASIYVHAGFSPTTAGILLGIATGTGIPLAFFLPTYAARHPQPRLVLVIILAFALLSYVGLLLAPHALGWVWAFTVAIGTASFPLILALLGLRASTAEGTAALSGFTQGVGYLIAALGPFLVGVLHQLTGSFQAPLLFMLALMVPFSVVALLACRPTTIEAELGRVHHD